MINTGINCCGLAVVSQGPRGYSAYEVAVQNGFKGSEQEWLNSLKGPKGDKGDTGLRGVQGPEGPTGPVGPQGPQGLTGPQGEQGPRGVQGPQGDRGPQGEPGLKGDKGDRGEQGQQGDKGDRGAQGDRGPQGERGPAGPQGEPGPSAYEDWHNRPGNEDKTEADFFAAMKGEKGDRGPEGPQGPVGLQGERGPQGLQGERGPQGLKGEKGDQGVQGPKGDKGDTGEQGPAGTIAVGTVTTLQAGSAATVTNTGTPEKAVLNFGIPKGKKGDTGLQGPQGERGDVGPQGPKGDTGLTGPQGPQGERGDTGATGPAGTVTPGNVTTLDPGDEATVVNVGSPEHAVLNFGIPQGEKGEAATIQMDHVHTGEPFTDASIEDLNPDDPTHPVLVLTVPRGASAYDLAKQQGYKGTEAEWVDSLKTTIAYNSVQAFPKVGDENTLYIAKNEDAVYRWNDEALSYYCVGRNYEEITYINGGNANG